MAGQDAPVSQEPPEIKENEHQCKEPEKENQSPTETRAGENHQPVRNPSGEEELRDFLEVFEGWMG